MNSLQSACYSVHDQIDKKLREESGKDQRITKRWWHLFLNGRDMWGFCRRIHVLCGYTNYNNHVDYVVQNLQASTNRNGDFFQLLTLKI